MLAEWMSECSAQDKHTPKITSSPGCEINQSLLRNQLPTVALEKEKFPDSAKKALTCQI